MAHGVEMIKFWLPNSRGKGSSQRGEIFGQQFDQWWCCSRATKFCTTTRLDQGKVYRQSYSPLWYQPIPTKVFPRYQKYLCSVYRIFTKS